MDGDDAFYVQSNKGQLQLTGDGGNDYFSVRSFILEDEKRLPKGGDGCEKIKNPISGELELATPDNCERDTVGMGGKKDDDYMQYDANAPVDIDGGEGYNTLVIIGTGKADMFVIDGQYFV